MTDPEMSDVVADYYSGYSTGNCTLYNPWSIVRFLNANKIANYWMDGKGSIAAVERNLSSELLLTTGNQSTVRSLISAYCAKD